MSTLCSVSFRQLMLHWVWDNNTDNLISSFKTCFVLMTALILLDPNEKNKQKILRNICIFLQWVFCNTSGALMLLYNAVYLFYLRCPLYKGSHTFHPVTPKITLLETGDPYDPGGGICSRTIRPMQTRALIQHKNSSLTTKILFYNILRKNITKFPTIMS